MIKTGDRIILKKTISVLGDNFINKEFIVTSVEDNLIAFKGCGGNGAMSKTEFEEYFKVVGEESREEVKEKTSIKFEDKKQTPLSKIKKIFRINK